MSIGGYMYRYLSLKTELDCRIKAYRGAGEHIKNLEILMTGRSPEGNYELNKRIRQWNLLLEDLEMKLRETNENIQKLLKEARTNHVNLSQKNPVGIV